MERQVAPEERFVQLRLGERLEATDEDLAAYVSSLLDARGKPPEEPDWVREAMADPPTPILPPGG